MNQTYPFLENLAGRTTAIPPIWLMRQAGRYLPEYRELRSQAGGFLELCLNPEWASEVTLQPIRRYGFDAAILFADILLIPMALGADLRFEAGEGPRLSPISSAEDLQRLGKDQLHKKLAPVYETLERVRESLKSDSPETALIGFAGAPWTVAAYMLQGRGGGDFVEAKRKALTNPDLFQNLIDLLVETTADYLITQIRHGAQAVQIFDSWAGQVPPHLFRDWVIEPTRRIVKAIRAQYHHTPIIGFPRGGGFGLNEYVQRTRVTALGLDSAVSCTWAAKNLQSLCPVQGNLDPVLLLTGGAAMEAGIDHILETLGQGAFVFNLGHGVIKETPPEHVAHLVDYIRKRASS